MIPDLLITPKYDASTQRIDLATAKMVMLQVASRRKPWLPGLLLKGGLTPESPCTTRRNDRLANHYEVLEREGQYGKAHTKISLWSH